MPRARCNWRGCTNHPLLTIPRRFVDDHLAYLERTGQHDRGGRCPLHGINDLLDADGNQRWHPRLCAEHAAVCGVHQLDVPRVYIQDELRIPHESAHPHP